MVHFYEGDEERVVYECYFADDQSWDEETLKQLKEEYNIYFMTSGDGVVPIKLIDNKLIVLGSEDDGTISFQKWPDGHYVHVFSIYWIESLISDLRAVHKDTIK